MDAPSIVALVLGVVAIVITIIGCTWNLSKAERHGNEADQFRNSRAVERPKD